MLDATHGATGAAAGSAVQRKPDAATSSTAHDEGPPTKAVPHAKWPVFDDTGLPYKIVSAKEPVRFWTVSDWVRSRAERLEGGGHAVSSACAAEIFEALGWVPKDKIRFAAARVVFDITQRVAEHQVDASAFYVLGLPTSRPVASHAVSRKGDHILQVATRLPDPDVPQGGVAFKVDKHGRPVPKGGFEILNPYERGRYQHQHGVFEQAVLNESHQEAVPANNQSYQEAVPE